MNTITVTIEAEGMTEADADMVLNAVHQTLVDYPEAKVSWGGE